MRYSDWQTRLSEFITSVSDRPFEWGHHDCALFAADCVLATTGTDPAVAFRGAYQDRAGAYAALMEYAGGGLAELAEKIAIELRFPENQKGFEQRGDIALCDQTGEDTLGVIDFSGKCVMIAGEHGIVRHPLTCVKRSWRVE